MEYTAHATDVMLFKKKHMHLKKYIYAFKNSIHILMKHMHLNKAYAFKAYACALTKAYAFRAYAMY